MKDRVCVEDFLADELRKSYGGELETEYAFHPHRQWRFDVAWPAQKLAVEIEGAFHASLSANRRDAEKQNAAIELGWRVLRFPASAVFTKKRLPRIVEQVGRVLTGVSDPVESACVLVGD